MYVRSLLFLSENPDCIDNEIWCQYIDTQKYCSDGIIREKCAGACKTCEGIEWMKFYSCFWAKCLNYDSIYLISQFFSTSDLRIDKNEPTHKSFHLLNIISVNSLWPEEVKDKFCPKYDGPIDVVSSQQECQQKCIGKIDCVGISYGPKDINSGYCYVCMDDYLAITYRDLGFYRKPGTVAVWLPNPIKNLSWLQDLIYNYSFHFRNILTTWKSRTCRAHRKMQWDQSAIINL